MTDNEKEKKGPGRPRISPKPMNLAKRYRIEKWEHDGTPSLWRHNEQFWGWSPTDKVYKVLKKEDIDAFVMTWLDKKGIITSSHNVNDVLRNLAVICHLPPGVTFPGWTYSEQPKHHYTAFKNGILDLDKGSFVAPTSSWFSPNTLPFDYDPAALLPSTWLGVLQDYFPDDQDSKDLLQEWFGYCLTTDTSFHKFMMFLGVPRSGKSTTANVLKVLVGEGNYSSVSLEQFKHDFRLIPIIGKLLNISGDTSERVIAAEDRIKQITGSDTITLDRKHTSAVSFVPTVKLLISANTPPHVTDRSDAIWTRLPVLPFTHQIPEGKRDRSMPDVASPDWPFRSELPGICNWALEGLTRLHKQGGFTTPKVSKEAISRYQKESNPTLEFLGEFYTFTGNTTDWVPCQRVYSHFRIWLDTQGLRQRSYPVLERSVAQMFPNVKTATLSGRGSPRAFRGLKRIQEVLTEKKLNEGIGEFRDKYPQGG